ncbi:MAG: GGDEF domain-containing protein [Lachnospiraceae bacterium]|nr:GGDEF domain-containing protein [Lachnospiraceae bacterium]
MNKIVSEKTELDSFVENVLVESYAKIFKVNVNTGEYEVYKNDGLRDDDGVLEDSPSIYDYIQRLITDKAIYPEYATACRRLANPEYVRKSVFSGEKRIVQSYRRRTAEGDRWITFAIITGAECSPENPTVLFTWREADSDTITLLDTLPTISSLYDKLIRINLSNNTYEPVIVDSDEQERLSGGVINMYEWWAGYSQNGNIASEDMGAFSTLTKTGSLQKRFAEDPSPISFRYRRKVNGEFRWVQLSISPSVEYSEENQIMLLTLKDIHEEYTAQERKHQELLDNMHRDALTNLYNRLKFNADIENVEKNSKSMFTCLYIDVNGLHELNNLLGHQKGDDMLCCVADTLRKYFPDENAYRIGGDEFVVTSFKLSKRAVELAVEEVRRDLLKDNYEISIGIEAGNCGENIEKIVAAAELAMRNDKANYYMNKGDRRRKRQMNEELEQMLVEKHDSERFLDIISHQFLGVFFVDHANDTARHIYTTDLFTDLLEETDNCFSAALRLYVDRFVKSEYDDRFNDILNYDKLNQKLSETGSLRITYQKTDGICMSTRILKDTEQKDGKAETIWIFVEETTEQ